MISIVIPAKDEIENLPPLLNELFAVLDSMKEPYEIIVIDDGSKDGTLPFLETLSSQKSTLRFLSFIKSYGQTTAFEAGFKMANGDFVITLDGDGQNDPKDIPKLFALRHTADLIVGRRIDRKDRITKKIISKVANAIRSRLCDDGVDDTGCSLKLFRREALQKVKLFKGMHRFFPALFRMEGLKVAQVDVNHRPRLKGKSHYHLLNRSIHPILDLLAVYWMRKRIVLPEIRK